MEFSPPWVCLLSKYCLIYCIVNVFEHTCWNSLVRNTEPAYFLLHPPPYFFHWSVQLNHQSTWHVLKALCVGTDPVIMLKCRFYLAGAVTHNTNMWLAWRTRVCLDSSPCNWRSVNVRCGQTRVLVLNKHTQTHTHTHTHKPIQRPFSKYKTAQSCPPSSISPPPTSQLQCVKYPLLTSRGCSVSHQC